MIFVLYKIDGDPSGGWDEHYGVIDSYDEITQSIINSYIPTINAVIRVSKEDVDSVRWIELYNPGGDSYDIIVFFNDSIPSRSNHNEILEKTILEHKSIIRSEKLDVLLSDR